MNQVLTQFVVSLDEKVTFMVMTVCISFMYHCMSFIALRATVPSLISQTALPVLKVIRHHFIATFLIWVHRKRSMDHEVLNLVKCGICLPTNSTNVSFVKLMAEVRPEIGIYLYMFCI